MWWWRLVVGGDVDVEGLSLGLGLVVLAVCLPFRVSSYLVVWWWLGVGWGSSCGK